MVHQVGSSEDYDKLARDTGDSSWSWKNIRKFIFVVSPRCSLDGMCTEVGSQHEKIVPPADGHNTRGEFIPENHGTRGLVSVSLPGNAQGIDQRVIATTRELASEFPFNPDTGGGDVLGVGWVQNSIGNGQRSSSSTAYLAEALKRPNVDVLINAHVTKLVQTGTTRQAGGTVPAFRALEFSSGPGGELFVVYNHPSRILKGL
jgi:choline dehydrogenase